MFAAWGVFATIGVYAALRMRDSKWWFRVHLVSNILCLSFTVVGAVLVAKYFEWVWFPFGDAHHWMGFFVILAAGLQSLIGLIAHFGYDPSRTSLPWIDRLHGFLGRAVYLGALCNIITGVPMMLSDLDPEQAKSFQWVLALMYCFVAAVISLFFWWPSEVARRPQSYQNLPVLQ